MLADQKVEQFLHDIESVSVKKHEIVMALRKLLFQVAPNHSEHIKYGGLVFSRAENKILMCGIFVYRNHLSLEFGQGFSFNDPNDILEGKGQFRRHIKLNRLSDINRKAVKGFIEQALEKSQ